MANDHVEFRVAPLEIGLDSLQAITPYVNGMSLVDLVGEFEAAARYRPSGGYGGIVPDYFTLGPLQAYYLGEGIDQWPSSGSAWLLGCDCGEAGCWPLAVQVNTTPDHVTWSGFSQPHRPQWDYTAFGPFVFERVGYEHAVAELAELLSY